MKNAFRKVLGITAFAMGLGMAGAASAIVIDTEFNFVPTTIVTCDNAVLTAAITCSSGAPDLVTAIVADNTGLVTLVSTVTLSPDPLGLIVGTNVHEDLYDATGNLPRASYG